MERQQLKRWGAVGAVCLLAAILRLHNLDFESLFMDEIHQVSYYPNSVAQLISDAARQQQPPLDYWIGHLVSKISYTDFSVRVPAALFGVGAVLLIVLLTERLTSLPIALAAGVVVALLPYHIYFSQHARPYSIAIFFFLAALLLLREVLTGNKTTLLKWMALFAVLLCFLYTRALAPLIVVVTVAVLSLILSALPFAAKGTTQPEEMRGRLLGITATCILAVLAYVPVLTGILQTGSRYAGKDGASNITDLFTGWSRFDPAVLWEAYVTQLEPVGYLLFPLIAFSMIFVIRRRFLVQHPEAVYLVGIFVLASLLHVYIFQSKTSFPFRAPYAIYLFPIAIILAAVGVSELLKQAPLSTRRYSNTTGILFGLLLAVYTMVYTIDFKSIRKVSDWRALTQYLVSKDPGTHLFVFDGLSGYGQWEPGAYGVARYTRSRLRGTTMDAIPKHVNKIRKAKYTPVFVFFYYRDYYLTSHSRYSFHPRPRGDIVVDLSPFEQDPDLLIKKFVSFYVIEPRTNSGRLPDDMLRVLEKLIKSVPETSALVEVHIAMAYLKKSAGKPGAQNHAARALALAPAKYKDKVRRRLAPLSTFDRHPG